VIAAEERAIDKYRHRTEKRVIEKYRHCSEEPLLRDFRNLRERAEEMIREVAAFAPRSGWTA
jgi:hypothetical protein